MTWVITNNGQIIDTFATSNSITKDEALELRDIVCDEENLFYDDIDVRLATDEEEKAWLEA